jgi:hypothetical protein
VINSVELHEQRECYYAAGAASPAQTTA